MGVVVVLGEVERVCVEGGRYGGLEEGEFDRRFERKVVMCEGFCLLE